MTCVCFRDDDMYSIASLMSMEKNSDIGNFDDFEDEDVGSKINEMVTRYSLEGQEGANQFSGSNDSCM